MRIATTVVFSIASSKLLHRDWYEYDGVVAWVKGASAAQNNLAASQSAFYNTVLQNYNTQFASQSNILSNLTSGWNQTFNKGINQYGYSPAEDTALRTQASEGTAKTYNQALTALNQQIGARGGGNTNGVVSGPDQELQAQIAAAGAADISGKQLGITESGYNTGRQNYITAASALGGVAGQYAPTSYGGLADSSGSAAFGSATQIQKENAAASPWNAIAGILGGAASAFTGGLASGLGSDMADNFGGGGGDSNALGGPGTSLWTPSYMPSTGAPSIPGAPGVIQ